MEGVQVPVWGKHGVRREWEKVYSYWDYQTLQTTFVAETMDYLHDLYNAMSTKAPQIKLDEEDGEENEPTNSSSNQQPPLSSSSTSRDHPPHLDPKGKGKAVKSSNDIIASTMVTTDELPSLQADQLLTPPSRKKGVKFADPPSHYDPENPAETPATRMRIHHVDIVNPPSDRRLSRLGLEHATPLSRSSRYQELTERRYPSNSVVDRTDSSDSNRQPPSAPPPPPRPPNLSNGGADQRNDNRGPPSRGSSSVTRSSAGGNPGDPDDSDSSDGDDDRRNRPPPRNHPIGPPNLPGAPSRQPRSSRAEDPGEYYFEMKLKPESVPQWNGNPETLGSWIIKLQTLAHRNESCFKALGRIVPERLTKDAERWYWSQSYNVRERAEKDWYSIRDHIMSYFMNSHWLSKQKAKAL
ncbi:hypothetical protein BD410DRAFT_808956 [Rickenella mellea]|uniref:Uncharacterized protein n=1 Tax=Rickenella mellea TaxID=50990 RepID=A0A4Y7PK01_9AGAM|nr:hypothetical protein BD410DRAFT_808956 [Rickenella mellea]